MYTLENNRKVLHLNITNVRCSDSRAKSRELTQFSEIYSLKELNDHTLTSRITKKYKQISIIKR